MVSYSCLLVYSYYVLEILEELKNSCLSSRCSLVDTPSTRSLRGGDASLASRSESKDATLTTETLCTSSKDASRAVGNDIILLVITGVDDRLA